MATRRSFAANAALALAAPALFLLLLEGILSLFGGKPLALTEDPLVGFASLQPLFIEDPARPGWMKTNPAKLTHFNPQGFAKDKPEGAYRIFSVGGSTTYGHPWRDKVSYSGWLRELLHAADPGRKWEVINAGGISYASYREAKLAEEIARYQPDLLVVYSGHNEFLEERTYRKAAEIPPLLREASALLDRTRTFSALRQALRKVRASGETASPGDGKAKPTLAAEVDDVLAKTIGPKTYSRDDTLHARVHEHFALSLRRIAGIAKAAGARALFVTTPGNERDCSPFKGEPTPGLDPAQVAQGIAAISASDSLLAAGRADEAAALLEPFTVLDPRNADLLYRAGKAALAAGRHGNAKRLLERALDEDVCPLRASTAMRDSILQVARETGSEVLDVTALLEAKTMARLGHPVLGEPEFVDHVHLSIDEYRAMAVAIVEKLASLGEAHPKADWREVAVPAVTETVMAGMGSRELGEGLHNIAKVLNWAGKHEDAARIAAQGLTVDSTGLEAIWSSLFVGAALERQGKSLESLPHYRRAVRLDPSSDMSRDYLFEALQRAGWAREAAYASAGAEGRVPTGSVVPAVATSSIPRNPAATVATVPGTPADPREKNAMLLLQEGKVAESLALLRELKAGESNRPGLLVTFGEAQRRSGDAVGAGASYAQALKLNPKEAKACLGLARLAEARRDIPEAVSQYAKALQLDPTLSEARQALSQALQGMSTAPVPR